jgi:imidazoleglycerol phosphate synthase glutamine amidotransferase subunit HisH
MKRIRTGVLVLTVALSAAGCNDDFLMTLPRDQIAQEVVNRVEIHVAVEEGPVMGVQFHPEKSGDAGLRMLGNFLERCRS